MNKPDTEAQNPWLDAILAAEVFATDPSFMGALEFEVFPDQYEKLGFSWCKTCFLKIPLGDEFPLM